jgi:hypothetical protein
VVRKRESICPLILTLDARSESGMTKSRSPVKRNKLPERHVFATSGRKF